MFAKQQISNQNQSQIKDPQFGQMVQANPLK